MQQPHTRENPGAGTPGLQGQTKILQSQNSESWPSEQTILRDGGWEFASIFVACGVSAMAAFSGGSLAEIEGNLICARSALLEAIAVFKDLKRLEEA